jgi:site-specific DNA recombinase
LVCWHPDRLHRSPRELEDFIDVVEASGAAVATVKAGDYDLSTATGRMSARIVGAVARHSSEQQAERQRRQIAQAAEAGKAHGGGARPFGYLGFAGPLEPTEAALVREAADRLLTGDGVRRIVADWTARGITTSTGKLWTTTSLKRILRSGRVAGLREHHGEVVADAVWPAILERDTWEQVRTLLADPSRRRGGFRARVYLLTGFLRCGVCERPMYARPQRGKPAFFCTEWHTRISVGPVDEVVSLRVRTAIQNVVRPSEQLNQTEAGAVRLEIVGIQADLKQWAEDHGDGLVTRAQLLAASERLQARLTATERRFDTLARRSPVLRYAGSWITDEEWSELGLDRQRALLGELVERVTVLPVGRTGRFDESRIQILWLA